MQIATLADRFSIYAQSNLALAYDPAAKEKSFFVCDIEEISAALKTGIKFPCLFLQVPEFEKSGLVDNAVENVECSFIILMQVKTGDYTGRLAAYDQCKGISDQIVNYMVEDTDEYYEGGQVKTAEGKFGPISDGIYGWGVNFGFEQAYNAEVDPDQRRPQ
jgi:hypothetical protein